MRSFLSGIRKRLGINGDDGILVVCSVPVITLLVLFSVLAISPGPVTEAVGVFLDQPLLILLNALPVFLCMLFALGVLNNVFYAGAITLVLFDTLSYINLLKIEGRDDPFVPSDIMLVKEGLAAAGEYELRQYPVYIAAIVLCALVLIALGVLFPAGKRRVLQRVSLGVVACLAFGVSVPTLYADKGLYESFRVPSVYNVTSIYNTLGFNYCFLHNLNLYPVDKPEGYSREETERSLAGQIGEERTPQVTPNVVFVMCEAFSDISNHPAFDFTDGGENPLAAYNEIALSDRAYSGHLVVSDYGAGTANTEFDVLTGLPTRMLSEKTTSAFRTVRRSINSLPRFFGRQGYNAYFMHPGDSWFYNRSSVYSYLGIDDQVFKEDSFSDGDIKGNMVSDEAFLRVLTADLDKRFKEEAPLFAYTVTIQNHQAYSTWKYNDPAILEPVPTSAPLSENDMAILNIYLYGLRDSVDMLVGLTEYLDSVSEPTLLVFFGDHRPTLGADYSVYKALGMDVGNTDTAEGLVQTNKTPLLLWANRAYAHNFPEALDSLELPSNGIISDHYLGAAVTELVGYSGKDGYYDFLNRARRTLPVVCGNAYMRADGTFAHSLTEEEAQIVSKTDRYLYYRMKDEKLIS